MAKLQFNIVIIGSGNMAHALGNLLASRHRIIQVVSRNASTGKKLATKLKAGFSTNMKDVYTQADFYLLCVPDDQLPAISKKLLQVNGIVVHHSGAQPLSVINGKQTAVIYPFVSVNPTTKLNTEKTSIYFNAGNRHTAFMVESLLRGYKFWSWPINDEEKLRLHLAGVLMNNFTNHLYLKASQLAGDITGALPGLSYLAQQSIENFLQNENLGRQTGPARRNDRKTIKKHLDLIKKDRELSQIYVSLSQSISKTYQHE